MKLTRWMAAAAVATAGLAVPANASADGAEQVSGVQKPIDAFGTYEMSGDLIGIWYTTDFDVLGFTPSGALRGAGTEEFVGCHDADGNGVCGADDPTGTIDFTFTYTGRFNPTTGALLHGRCHHPITGGTGDFAGVSGVLNFHDDPATGCSYYTGHLRWD